MDNYVNSDLPKADEAYVHMLQFDEALGKLEGTQCPHANNEGVE